MSCVKTNHKAYNVCTLNYYSDKEKLGCRVFSVCALKGANFVSKHKYDYVIYKDKDATDIISWQNKINEAIAYIRNNSD